MLLFYLITNVIFAIVVTIVILSIAKIPIKIKTDFTKKKLVTKIEKELSASYNYFIKKSRPRFESYIEMLVRNSEMKLNLELFYCLSILFSILGGSIGYYLKFPFLSLVLTVTFSFIPGFILFMVGAYKNIKSYKATFKVLHTAEKASQLSNSPLVIFKKILPYLYERDRKQFNIFLQSFDMNKPYFELFNELERNLNNKFLKELVIYGRETANGINYNEAINLILKGYDKTYELLQIRKQNISGFVYFLYVLSLSFIVFSLFISSNYMEELQNMMVIQIFFKTTILAVVLGVVLGSIALINANQY